MTGKLKSLAADDNEKSPSETVSASFVEGLIAFAVQRGASRTRLLALSRIKAKDLADPDHRITLTTYLSLMRAAKELLGDPELALHFGSEVNLSDLSIVGNLGLDEQSIEAGLEQLNKFSRLMIDVDLAGAEERLTLAHDRDGLWIVDNRARPNAHPDITESAFARLVCWTRAFSAPGKQLVSAMEVTHAAPAHAAAYDRVLQIPVRFGAARNALRLNAGWSPVRIDRPSSYVDKVLKDRAEGLLKTLDADRTVRSRVEAILAARLAGGDVSMESVAASMSMTRQTLFRRLKDEGAGFEAVLDDLRRRLALDYLQGGRASLGEIAYLVGFSDAAALSRAFKRWTGRSPSEAKAETRRGRLRRIDRPT